MISIDVSIEDAPQAEFIFAEYISNLVNAGFYPRIGESIFIQSVDLSLKIRDIEYLFGDTKKVLYTF